MQAVLDTLDKARGIRIATLYAMTVPRLVTGNPFGGKTMNHSLRKIAGCQWLIGPASTATKPGFYSAVVNTRLAKEGSADAGKFVAEATWGDAILRADGSALPYVTHTPKGGEPTLYLPGIHLRSLERQYALADGTAVTVADAERWIPERTEGARQGLDNPVIYRKYMLCHVVQLRTGGEIVDGDAMELVELLRKPSRTDAEQTRLDGMIHDYAK